MRDGNCQLLPRRCGRGNEVFLSYINEICPVAVTSGVRVVLAKTGRGGAGKGRRGVSTFSYIMNGILVTKRERC